MNSSAILTTATIIAMLGAHASAQSLPSISHEGSSITLAYNFHNDDDDDPYSESFTTQLSASSRYSFGSNIGAAFTFGYNNEEYEEEFYSERYILDLNPYYMFDMGTVGVYYTAVAYNDGDEATHSLYGANANLKFNRIGVEAYAGVYEEEGDFEDDTYGLATSFDVTDDATAYLSYRRDVDGDSWSGLATLGATYSLNALVGVPISITGEVARFTDDDTGVGDSEWNQFSIMASYDFGNGAQSIFRGFRAVDYYYD
jgi:hypothetical protein